MLFPALGMSTAIWLMTAPLLGVETGFRAGFTVTVGLLAFVLTPFSLWFPRAGQSVAALGILLGFANLFLSAPIEAYASLATCAVLVTAAGLAPRPIVTTAVPLAVPLPKTTAPPKEEQPRFAAAA